MRLCLNKIQSYGGIDARLLDGLSMNGRLTYPFSRQNSDVVTPLSFPLTSARSYGIIHNFFLDDQPTRAHTDCVPSLHRATETALETSS
eukprot:4112547-Pleurochrysis_carterae.AAC.4